MNTFIEKYFLPPVGITPENRVFSMTHIIISTILFAIIFFVYYSVIKKRNQEYSTKVLKICAALMLGLEIFRISWNAYFHGFQITNFRFDFCNQICMFLPWVILLGDRKLYPYFELLAIVGGFTVLVYPLWVFYDYAGFHIMALQSMTSHALMLLCGLIMPFSSGKIPTPRDEARDSLVGFSIILVVAFVMSNITGENYLLMKGANGVPVLELIPFPYYWIVFLGVAYILAYSLSVVYHDFLCLFAKISLTKDDIYFTDTLNFSELKNLKSFLKFKFLKPFKYKKFKAEYLGAQHD